MPLTLNIGVVDVPYSTPPAAAGKEAKPNSATTGDVAGWLEDKYHLYTHFYEFNRERIAQHVAESLAGALESAAMGAPAGGSPFAAAESAIDAEFRTFLTQDVMATLGYPGVPTKAALDGVNHRLKAKKGAPRPSFVDTGTMLASQKNWFEQS